MTCPVLHERYIGTRVKTEPDFGFDCAAAINTLATGELYMTITVNIADEVKRWWWIYARQEYRAAVGEGHDRDDYRNSEEWEKMDNLLRVMLDPAEYEAWTDSVSLWDIR